MIYRSSFIYNGRVRDSRTLHNNRKITQIIFTPWLGVAVFCKKKSGNQSKDKLQRSFDDEYKSSVQAAHKSDQPRHYVVISDLPLFPLSLQPIKIF